MTSDHLDPPGELDSPLKPPASTDPSENGATGPEVKADAIDPHDAKHPASPKEPFSENQPTVISKHRRRSSSNYPHAATPAELGETLAGRRLDYFQLEEFVGGGGMGAVFRATDTKLGRTVAVKVLSPYQTDEDNLKRFKNEAQTAARLDHANIARVYYVGEDDGWHFIVFEFIEGVNLRDLVNHKGPLSVKESLTYTLQVAAALDHSSHRELVHRDIKPSNVLITPDGQAKLVDMGLARMHQIETNSADLTASGVTLGTFDYISPEQARDPRNADVRSDLYSLGCTLYFMLTGVPPFPGGTVLQKLLSHSSDTPAELQSFRNDLSDEVVQIVDRMLAKQPAERYQTPAELIADTSVLAGQLGITDKSPGFSHWVEPPSRRDSLWERHLPWAAPLVALILFVLVLDRVTKSRTGITVMAPRFAEQPFERESSGSSNASSVNQAGTTAQTPGETATPNSAGTNPPAENLPDNNSETPPGKDDINNQREGDTSAADNSRPGGNPEETAITSPAGSSTTTTSPSPTQLVEPPSPDALDETKPATVLVQARSGVLPPGFLGVDSLSAAIELVHRHPSITTIEIARSGSMEVHPFLLRLGPDTGRRLTIRATEGAKPLLVFRPTEFDLETPAPTMIHLTGGNLTIENLHIRLELPGEFRQSWTLFALQDVERLLLEKSSLTVASEVTADPGHPVTGVAFFDFFASEADATRETPNDLEQMPTPVPQLVLQDFIARGPATLVRTEGAIPFKLRWNNGLLVTNQRLLETVGSETKPRWQDGVIDIELQHLTAAVREGLCLMKGSERRPYAVEVMTNCQNCIIITDSNMPLYLQRGFTDAESIGLRPKIAGSSNYYQNTDLVLKVELRDLAAEEQLFTFEYIQTNRNSSFIRPWYDEMNYRPGTMISWRQQQVPPTDLPLTQHTVDNYLLDDQDASFEMEPPGVIADQLPAIPATSVQQVPATTP